MNQLGLSGFPFSPPREPAGANWAPIGAQVGQRKPPGGQQRARIGRRNINWKTNLSTDNGVGATQGARAANVRTVAHLRPPSRPPSAGAPEPLGVIERPTGRRWTWIKRARATT